MQELKPAVVIDNGTGYIKAGLAGDDAPKTVFPSVVGYSRFEQIPGADGKNYFVGEEALSKKGVLTLKYPLEHGIVHEWKDIEKIWRHCYFDQLMVNPEEHPVLLTEAALNPKENREKIIQLFFETFRVPEFFVFTQAVLGLYAGGRTTGLVCDSGDGVTHLVVVYDGYSMKHVTKRVNLAGRDLTNYMQKYLAEDGYSFESTAEREIAKEIKEKLCYVALDFDQEMKEFQENPEKKKEFTLPDGQKIKVGDVCIRTPECLFKPSLLGSDISGVHKMIVDSIQSAEIDLRPVLYQSITLSGGSTMFEFFLERLNKEIAGLIPDSIKLKVIAPVERKFSVWIGGSVLSTLPTFQASWITREEYNEVGPSIVHRKCF